jgi:hypothetical protein
LLEEIICERCGGPGIVEVDGHKDVCPECMGLGILRVEKTVEKLSDSKKSLKRFVVWVMVFLSAFYIVFFYFYIVVGFNATQMIIILLTGHAVALTSIVMYMLFGSVYNSTT